MTVYKWSQTAASNATADGTINYAEGQAPSSLNDSARALMAAVAKYRDDNSGSLTTGGTSTAYTLTTNQVFSSLSAMSGQSLRVKFNATNGASPTLSVDSLGAKALQTVAGTAIGTGALKANSVYDLVYDNSNNCWIVVGAPPDALLAPSGTALLFQQTAAPTGWTKSTTHNDKALRVVSGTASSGGSTAFTTVFAARTVAQANLPNVNFTVTDPGHTHGIASIASLTAQQGTNSTYTTYATSGTAPPTINSATTGITVASGGSGTALDFAVQYVDCVICTKD